MMSGEELLQALFRVVCAGAFALPIGLERAPRKFGPGVRTFPLLSMATAGFVMIAQQAFPDSPDAEARVVQALVSGMGFIGAGAIVKGRGHVHGVASAASLWMTMAVGMATGFSLYFLAILLSGVTLVTLWGLGSRVQPPFTTEQQGTRTDPGLEGTRPDGSERR